VERLIERHELIVSNNDHQATRCGKNCRLIIDLTLSTRRVGALAVLEIDENLTTASDHEVIVFSWPPLVATKIQNESTTAPNWNIDRLCADEKAMRAAGEQWHELGGRRAPISSGASKAELEDEARWMQDSSGLDWTSTLLGGHRAHARNGGGRMTSRRRGGYCGAQDAITIATDQL
jgi:hypothetical protein